MEGFRAWMVRVVEVGRSWFKRLLCMWMGRYLRRWFERLVAMV